MLYFLNVVWMWISVHETFQTIAYNIDVSIKMYLVDNLAYAAQSRDYRNIRHENTSLRSLY